MANIDSDPKIEDLPNSTGKGSNPNKLVIEATFKDYPHTPPKDVDENREKAVDELLYSPIFADEFKKEMSLITRMLFLDYMHRRMASVRKTITALHVHHKTGRRIVNGDIVDPAVARRIIIHHSKHFKIPLKRYSELLWMDAEELNFDNIRRFLLRLATEAHNNIENETIKQITPINEVPPDKLLEYGFGRKKRDV